jgi:AraC family transcriptional regulator
MGKNLDAGSTLIVTEGCAIFIGGLIATGIHEHHAMQVSIDLEGKFSVDIEGKELSTSSILIDSDRSHKISSAPCRQLLCLFEGESPRGAALKGLLGEAGYVLPELPFARIDAIRLLAEKKEISLREIVGALFSGLGLLEDPPVDIDPRTEAALSILKRAPGKKLGIVELARMANISESRMQHLFKRDTGISVKRYLLWKRLIDGILILLEGKDITYASYEAGFFDPAHFSRTFKEMFGLKPFEVFKDSGSVQARRGCWISTAGKFAAWPGREAGPRCAKRKRCFRSTISSATRSASASMPRTRSRPPPLRARATGNATPRASCSWPSCDRSASPAESTALPFPRTCKRAPLPAYGTCCGPRN